MLSYACLAGVCASTDQTLGFAKRRSEENEPAPRAMEKEAGTKFSCEKLAREFLCKIARIKPGTPKIARCSGIRSLGRREPLGCR